MSWGVRKICRGEGDEEWAEVGGLLATRGHGDVRDWVAAKALAWVHGPAADTLCVDVHCSCYH